MNPDTGHLVDTSDMNQEQLDQLRRLGYLRVPPNLQRAARKKLSGRREARVSLTSGGKLSKWAARVRKARKRVRSYRDGCN